MIVRRSVAAYLLTIGLLGILTAAWAIGGLLVDRLWLAVARLGTALTAALLWAYVGGWWTGIAPPVDEAPTG